MIPCRILSDSNPALNAKHELLMILYVTSWLIYFKGELLDGWITFLFWKETLYLQACNDFPTRDRRCHQLSFLPPLMWSRPHLNALGLADDHSLNSKLHECHTKSSKQCQERKDYTVIT